ncbi:hypothetical protein [Vibrio sp. JPW-9-11-11]|uniref:hypothetical protein n=1 Tax=Vibrio sp. JPW-9-11-11 TaxID=1416532 RepID=UPI001594D7CF|nr:hypothetical protein [Vibrio sp. JPW-9-11-11]
MSNLLSVPITRPEQPYLLPEDYQIRGNFLFRVSILPTRFILPVCAQWAIARKRFIR